jgi:hypothetical protein
MSLKYKCGDLFEDVKIISQTHSVIIPHIVNDKGRFASGFVVPLAQHYPEAKSTYLNWAEGNIAPMFTGIFELGFCHIVPINDNLTIIHMLAQTLGGKRPLYYNHLASCMEFIRVMAEDDDDIKIIAPAFGSNRAGGNWLFIEELINDIWIRDDDLDVTIYYLGGTLPEVEKRVSCQ